jgi:hypothetical protein
MSTHDESVAWFVHIKRVAATLSSEDREAFLATARDIWRLKEQVDALTEQASDIDKPLARILKTVTLAIRCGKVRELDEALSAFAWKMLVTELDGDEEAARSLVASKSTEQGH